ncbi:cupin domain-containing protein [Streptomyces sp. 2A115]|uniref:cupin domain-containing protein n=1 Tax=Streptomyces sp. 2A115 TaxID=3457439 RepID=UPI003FD0640F
MITRCRVVDMADVVSSARLGGSDWALLTPKSVGATSGFMGVMALEPGEYVSKHAHPFSDEFICVTEGVLEVEVEGVEHRVSPGEAVFIERGEAHRFRNDGDARMFAVYHISPLAPSPDQGHVDLEPVPAPDDIPPQVGG